MKSIFSTAEWFESVHKSVCLFTRLAAALRLAYLCFVKSIDRQRATIHIEVVAIEKQLGSAALIDELS